MMMLKKFGENSIYGYLGRPDWIGSVGSEDIPEEQLAAADRMYDEYMTEQLAKLSPSLYWCEDTSEILVEGEVPAGLTPWGLQEWWETTSQDAYEHICNNWPG